MLPLRDEIRSRRWPFVTVLLILINTVVFLYSILSPEVQFNEFVYRYGMIPAYYSKLLRGGGPIVLNDFYPFITSMFLHGGLFHLISNMWVLWLFGDNVEDRMGHFKFLLFYILSGIIAGIIHFVFNPLSPYPTVGASGAIAGVMGAYFILYPRARILTAVPSIFIIPIIVHIPAVVYLLFWFFSQLYSGTIQTLAGGGAVSGVAWWAHVGGFLFGAVFHGYFEDKWYGR
ncbi:MAG: rhomboid family intramembrane serine protease [Thermoanaerobacteraceae bacterium]|nr:rhomboid family intramembrane serine protease [Thermoanaerobacteraceae bacterium]